jgi:hypothetical protein
MPVILATQEAEYQEDSGWKPAPGKLFKRPYLKNTQQKKGW